MFSGVEMRGEPVNPRPMVRLACAFLALLIAAAPARASGPAAPDEAVLRQLNAEYVRAYLACDVARFSTLIADDFTGVLADGRAIDRAEFLRQAAQRPDARDLRLHDVAIRILVQRLHQAQGAIGRQLARIRQQLGVPQQIQPFRSTQLPKHFAVRQRSEQ